MWLPDKSSRSWREIPGAAAPGAESIAARPVPNCRPQNPTGSTRRIVSSRWCGRCSTSRKPGAWAGGNPCRFVQKYKEKKRERFLTDEEVTGSASCCSAFNIDRRPAVVGCGVPREPGHWPVKAPPSTSLRPATSPSEEGEGSVPVRSAGRPSPSSCGAPCGWLRLPLRRRLRRRGRLRGRRGAPRGPSWRWRLRRLPGFRRPGSG